MADSSLNSPRRMLSLSKERAVVSISDSDERVADFSVSEEHGPKPSEVYGFVGSITTVAATVIFLAWAYIPESWLHFLGITYYPNRYWAISLPTYVIVATVLALAFYIGLNFIITPPSTSLNTLFDEYSRDPSNLGNLGEKDQPIEPISDIGIHEINRRMFLTGELLLNKDKDNPK